jgi:tetratricopeptide (TPR) repeat protein
VAKNRGKSEHIDIFTKITKKIELFIVKYLKVIVISVSVVIVALALYFSIDRIYSKKEENADKAFSKVYLVYKRLLRENEEETTEEEKTEKLLDLNEDFKIVINDYPNSKAAMKSAYFIGNTLFNSGKYEEAIEFYKKGYSNKGKTFYVSMLCLLSEASCYEQLEDYEKAEQVYEKILKDFDEEFIIPFTLYNLGQIQEKQNKFQNASDKFSTIVSEYDWSSWMQFAERKLLLIKNFQL